MTVKCAFVMWDWKEQVPETDLNEAMREVFDGTHCPVIMHLDTGGDDFALCVSSEPVDSETAHKLFADWYESL